MSDIDKMYHCCRWCKYYEKGKCVKGFAVVADDEGIYSVAEMGGLSEAIEEVLNERKPVKVLAEIEAKLAEYGISEKRRKELRNLWEELIPEFLDFDLKPKLDNAISVLYQGYADNSEAELEIKEPESFYCKYFW